MVVIKGLAMTAGSKPIRSAVRGRTQPITLAIRTTTTRVRQTIRATWICTRSTTRSLIKLHTERVTPHMAATRISFHMACRVSLNSISPREIPRMMETLAWEPALPPVSMSMGM